MCGRYSAKHAQIESEPPTFDRRLRSGSTPRFSAMDHALGLEGFAPNRILICLTFAIKGEVITCTTPEWTPGGTVPQEDQITLHSVVMHNKFHHCLFFQPDRMAGTRHVPVSMELLVFIDTHPR